MALRIKGARVTEFVGERAVPHRVAAVMLEIATSTQSREDVLMQRVIGACNQQVEHLELLSIHSGQRDATREMS
ncbi:MAG: hypothetical protein ABIR68_08590 [Ilumatobacteraceae bacterium]